MSGVFRREYRKLTEREVAQVEAIKDAAQKLHDRLWPSSYYDVQADRELALARTKLEECVMWAVKGVTG